MGEFEDAPRRLVEEGNSNLTYYGVVPCRDCPDDDRQPSVAVILPSDVSADAGLRPDSRLFVRAADGVVELLRAENHCFSGEI